MQAPLASLELGEEKTLLSPFLSPIPLNFESNIIFEQKKIIYSVSVWKIQSAEADQLVPFQEKKDISAYVSNCIINLLWEATEHNLFCWLCGVTLAYNYLKI